MKIFFIVIAMLSGNAHTDLFVISTPSFQDSKTCIEFVNVNTESLILKAKLEYPNQDVDNVYCISKEKLKKLAIGTTEV